jgi:regulator of nonsense transcripts 3
MVPPAPSQPVVKIAKPPQPPGSGGVLPVSTAGPKPKVTGSHGQSGRHLAPGLKVNVRRLPPGLTKDEFQTAMGDEWNVGTHNVDWYYYAPGKVSKE